MSEISPSALLQGGKYKIEKISVIRADMNDYATKLARLATESPSETLFGTDEINCEISLRKDKYMLLSIPYSEGWKAYVDEQETSIFRANECYMAVFLPKGSHHVRLHYETPYLKLGAYISIVSFAVLIGCIIVKKRKMMKEK